ncbi:hypothetical protein TCARB_1330 [Thermofilum adornatum 1505]|uniref:Uncharacterized protein n=1 Tax=Thermofilum adornatum 1505 TaxID=697581 RepID=A0A3G1A654_9CREN|nr:hypothetical protein TCARB_1330 [Thermofilum adornatum 1505]
MRMHIIETRQNQLTTTINNLVRATKPGHKRPIITHSHNPIILYQYRLPPQNSPSTIHRQNSLSITDNKQAHTHPHTKQNFKTNAPQTSPQNPKTKPKNHQTAKNLTKYT